nr:WhiB family transcriptional regulator [Parafrankia discariae]
MGNPAPLSVRYGSDWRLSALCRDQDPELFFPIGTTGPAERQAAQARAVCAGCPVRVPCLTDSIGEADGVWAGLDPTERDPLARAHSVYLAEVARLDSTLPAAVDERARLASRALAAEGDTTAALALTIAAGADRTEIETAAQIAAATSTETAVLLGELGVTHPTRLRQAAERLLTTAIAIAFPATPTLAVAS